MTTRFEKTGMFAAIASFLGFSPDGAPPTPDEEQAILCSLAGRYKLPAYAAHQPAASFRRMGLVQYLSTQLQTTEILFDFEAPVLITGFHGQIVRATFNPNSPPPLPTPTDFLVRLQIDREVSRTQTLDETLTASGQQIDELVPFASIITQLATPNLWMLVLENAKPKLRVQFQSFYATTGDNGLGQDVQIALTVFYEPLV